MGPALWKPPRSPGPYRELAQWLEVLWVLIASVLASVSSVCSAPATLGRSPFLLLTSGAFREQDWWSCTGQRWSPLPWSPPPPAAPELHMVHCHRCPPASLAGYVGRLLPLGTGWTSGVCGLGHCVLSLELLKETWGFFLAKEARPVSRETSERRLSRLRSMHV